MNFDGKRWSFVVGTGFQRCTLKLQNVVQVKPGLCPESVRSDQSRLATSSSSAGHRADKIDEDKGVAVTSNTWIKGSLNPYDGSGSFTVTRSY